MCLLCMSCRLLSPAPVLSCANASSSYHRPLSTSLAPLLQADLDAVLVRLKELFPPAVAAMQQPEVR